MNMRRFVLLAVVAASIALSLPAAAASIVLSEESSDSTPASDLDATMDFSVVGTTLTLVVTNTTSAPGKFNINEIFSRVLHCAIDADPFPYHHLTAERTG
jgi:hypothetical protein